MLHGHEAQTQPCYSCGTLLRAYCPVQAGEERKHSLPAGAAKDKFIAPAPPAIAPHFLDALTVITPTFLDKVCCIEQRQKSSVMGNSDTVYVSCVQLACLVFAVVHASWPGTACASVLCCVLSTHYTCCAVLAAPHLLQPLTKDSSQSS